MTSKKVDNYGIKAGYSSRLDNAYYDDFTGDTVWQPDVYTALISLARRAGISTIIDIGSGNGEKLIDYKDEFKFIFVDFGPNLDVIKKNIGEEGNQYIDQDFEKGFPKFSKKVLSSSMVICSDVIEHMRNPQILAAALADFSKDAPFVLVSTPDRPRTRGIQHFGPPDNHTHVREWAAEELDTYLRSKGMGGHLTAITRSNDYEQAHRTIFILAGKFVDNLTKRPKVKPGLGVRFSSKEQAAKDYLWSEDMVVASDQADILLEADEWLAFSPREITTGAVIADAKKRGYAKVKAQVIYVNPSSRYNWPEAGIVRQGHGLIGFLGEVRTLQLSSDGSTTHVEEYPFHLTIFKKMPATKNNLLSRALHADKLIDTGHLMDDYLVESIIGWDIRS